MISVFKTVRKSCPSKEEIQIEFFNYQKREKKNVNELFELKIKFDIVAKIPGALDVMNYLCKIKWFFKINQNRSLKLI